MFKAALREEGIDLSRVYLIPIPDIEMNYVWVRNVMMLVPPFHIAGILANLLLPTYIGAKTVLLPKFNPRETLAAISQYRITYFMAVPAIYSALLSVQNREPDRYSLLSVKFAHTGTSPCPIYLLQEFDKRFKYGLLNAYGLTETAGVCITNLTKFNKFGSVGFPLPDLEIKIIDPRTGKISQSGG